MPAMRTFSGILLFLCWVLHLCGRRWVAGNYCAENITLPTLPEDCSSCAGRCGQETKFSGKSFCACDAGCQAYGDCCPDFKKECPDEVDAARAIDADSPKKHGGSSCETKNGRSYMLINVCRESGILCSRSTGFLNRSLEIPIIDIDSGLHYVNSECALCNNVRRGRPWEAFLRCNFEVNETDTLTRENLEKALLEKRCSVIYPTTTNTTKEFPRRMFPGCSKIIIDRCSANCKNQELVRRCEAPVQSITSSKPKPNMRSGGPTIRFLSPATVTNYKNYYCGLCYHAQEELQCSNFFEQTFASRDSRIASRGKLGPAADPPRRAETFSVHLLFDFDPSQGLVVGRTSGDLRRRCPEGQVFVDSEGQCRQVGCLEGQRLLNGSCVNNQANATLVIGLDFNQTKDAQFVGSFFENSTNNVKLVGILQRDLQQIITTYHSMEDQVEVVLTKSSDGPHKLNITLFLDFLFGMNSTFDPRTDFYGYKDNATILLNGFFLNLLDSLDVDVRLVEITVEGVLTFQRLPTRNCVWLIYNESDYEIINDTLRLFTRSEPFAQEDFRVVGNGPTLVCTVVSKNQYTRIDLKVSPALGIISLVCIILSIICLFIRMVLHACVSFFRSFAGHMQFNLCLALFLAFILLLVAGTLGIFPSQRRACRVVGIIMYWAFLAAFCWMTAIAFDTFIVFRPSATFKRAEQKAKALVKYILVGWVFPAILTIVVVVIDSSSIEQRFRPGFGEGICWFSERYALLIYFGVPVAVSTIVTLGLFTAIVIHLRNTFRAAPKVGNDHESHRLWIYARLFALMGICWVIGFIAAFVGHIALWIIFILLNASQGVFIFFSFVLRRAVLREISEVSRTETKSTSLPSRGGSLQTTEATNSENTEFWNLLSDPGACTDSTQIYIKKSSFCSPQHLKEIPKSTECMG